MEFSVITDPFMSLRESKEIMFNNDILSCSGGKRGEGRQQKK